MKQMRICFLLVLLLGVEILVAQGLDEIDRRWAVSGSLGGAYPVITQNTTNGKGASMGSLQSLMLEYYVPSSRFSLRGGYSYEELEMSTGVSASLNNLEIGGRYYFLPQRFMVQPYGGLSLLGNLSRRSDNGVTSGYSKGLGDKDFVKDYECRYRIREPLLSVGPAVGADLYILSCLALSVEYSFRMGIDGRMVSEVDYYRPRKSSGVVSSNGMRHAFSIGLKVNFPFTITESDGTSIWQYIHEAIWGY